MDTHPLTILGVTAACLLAVVWLAAVAGLLPTGIQSSLPGILSGGTRLTQAPDKTQGPGAGGSPRPRTASGNANNGAPPAQAAATASRPEPKPTATPPTQETKPKPRYTTSNTVNVRAGQGTNFGVVGQVKPGQAVTLTQDPGGQWIRIQGENVKGWVYRPLFHKTQQ